MLIIDSRLGGPRAGCVALSAERLVGWMASDPPKLDSSATGCETLGPGPRTDGPWPWSGNRTHQRGGLGRPLARLVIQIDGLHIGDDPVLVAADESLARRQRGSSRSVA
jgi:hypothetical protein